MVHARRPPWNSDIKDPSLYRLSRAEMLRKKALLLSHNNVFLNSGAKKVRTASAHRRTSQAVVRSLHILDTADCSLKGQLLGHRMSGDEEEEEEREKGHGSAASFDGVALPHELGPDSGADHPT
jgi:precorrin-6x reductase